MSSSRRTSKPPRPFESLASLKAAKKTYCSIDYQIECLNELYNQLIPQNRGNDRRAGSSNDHQDGFQRDSKALQQLKRELKANLRSNYGNPRLFPPLERLKVVVMFDDHKKAFFDIRLRPLSGYPTGYPFLIDDSEGSIVGLSEAIYQEVLKAVQEEEEEEEEERDRDEGHNNNNNHNNNNSHAAEDFLDPVNIKQEVVDEEEEEEELITLDDDSDEDESLNNELQQEESYNSQVNRPQSPENNAVPESEDLIVSAISAAASSSSVPAIVPPENGSPAVNPQATDTNTTNTTSSSSNTAEQQRQRRQQEQSVSQGHSETVPIKLEPAETSTVTITRRGRPSNRASRTGHNEAPTAAGAASVAVPPAHAAAAAAAVAANSRLLQVNSQTTITKVFLSQSKPQQQQQQLPPPSHHLNNNNNGTTPSAQQRQQQPPAAAAAAAVTACGTLTMRPTENSSIFHIVGSKRPADNLNAAQPSHSQPAQGNPKRAKVSAVSSPLVSRPSAAAADKRRAGVLAAATASTTSAPSTTSTPSTASTSQQQHHQQHRQRPSTSTAIALAAVTAANVEDYLRAHCPSYFSVKDAQTKVQCPDCPKSMIKYQLKDHLLWVHHGLRPYHCQWPGCGFTTGWKNSAANHAKNVHNGSYTQYIVYREE